MSKYVWTHLFYVFIPPVWGTMPSRAEVDFSRIIAFLVRSNSGYITDMAPLYIEKTVKDMVICRLFHQLTLTVYYSSLFQVIDYTTQIVVDIARPVICRILSVLVSLDNVISSIVRSLNRIY